MVRLMVEDEKQVHASQFFTIFRGLTPDVDEKQVHAARIVYNF